MKNIIITGGAGFIGSHLSHILVDEPDTNVIVIDNFITSDFYNIEEFIRKQNFEFIKHDLTQPLDIGKYIELAKFKIHIYGIDEIYHLACPTSPKDYDRLPLETCLANSHATKNALDLARIYKSRFLFSSSSAVYGKVPLEKQPVSETQWGHVETLGPRSCYLDGKRFAENLILYYGSEHNFQTKILRIFNTYGPKMRLADGRIIPDMVNQALKNEPVVIYGDKNTTSTFCYIADLIDCVIKMMDSNETGPFNVGGEQLYTLADIAKSIIEITNSTSNILYKDPIAYREIEPIPDIRRVRDALGWLPITPLEDGLVKTIKAIQASIIHKFNPITQ